MMFLVIERENSKDFANAINTALSQGFKIINSGFSKFKKTQADSFAAYKNFETTHWAYLLNDQNQCIGDYPYPPTRTFE